MMATFLLFYSPLDLAELETGVKVTNISGSDRTLLGRVWNGGLKNWQSAPQALGGQYQAYAGNDPDCRVVTVTASGVTAASFCDLLSRVFAANPNMPIIRKLAVDIRKFGSVQL